MGRDPNEPMDGVSLRDGPRYLDPPGSGDAAKDGFTRRARTPRINGVDECMSPSDADEMESRHREFSERYGLRGFRY